MSGGDGYVVVLGDGRYLGFAEGVLCGLDDPTLAALLTRSEAEEESRRWTGSVVVRWGDDPLFEVDVDGHVDARGIRYIGKARRTGKGRYLCLADVEGCLCRVEVTLTFGEVARG